MTVTSSRAASAPAVPQSPPGTRSPRRQWRDPRLLTGVVLVVASALGEEAPLWGGLLVATSRARRELRLQLQESAAH